MFIDIKPVPKPRMTQADRWKKRPCVLRYFEFKDELVSKTASLNFGDTLECEFQIPMPESWSKKKKELMFLKPHKQRPDIDNLAKAVMDAVFKEDSHIFRLKVSKVWAVTGGIMFTNYAGTKGWGGGKHENKRINK